MQHQSPLPTAFETLAAVVKFIAAPKMSTLFYHQHQNAIDLTCTFLKILANRYPLLETAFRKSLPLPVVEGAACIATALTESKISDADLNWLDAQSTAVLRLLVPVVRSENLPKYLIEARWAVLGAFENDSATS